MKMKRYFQLYILLNHHLEHGIVSVNNKICELTPIVRALWACRRGIQTGKIDKEVTLSHLKRRKNEQASIVKIRFFGILLLNYRLQKHGAGDAEFLRGRQKRERREIEYETSI